MKVAFFTFSILEHGGGLEKYFINTAKDLSQRYTDLELSIVTCDERMNENLIKILSFYYFKRIDKSKIYREKTSEILKSLGNVKYIKCSNFHMLKEELRQYDVIYSKNELLDLGTLKIIGFKNLGSIITGIHTPIFYPKAINLHSKLHNFLYLGPIYKWLLKDIKLIHVVNEDDRILIKKKFRQKVLKVLYPFKVNIRKIHDNHQSSFHILFVGRITEQKGINLLIECLDQLSLKDNFRNIKMKIAGSGDSSYESQLTELAQKFENITFLGHIANSQISKLYEWTDITVIPSNYETVNYVALETGSYGKIALASDIPGPREVIQDQVTGFLINPVAGDFIKKILELYELKIAEPKKFANIGSQARKYISVKFNPNKIYSRLYSILKDYAKKS